MPKTSSLSAPLGAAGAPQLGQNLSSTDSSRPHLTQKGNLHLSIKELSDFEYLRNKMLSWHSKLAGYQPKGDADHDRAEHYQQRLAQRKPSSELMQQDRQEADHHYDRPQYEYRHRVARSLLSSFNFATRTHFFLILHDLAKSIGPSSGESC